MKKRLPCLILGAMLLSAAGIGATSTNAHPTEDANKSQSAAAEYVENSNALGYASATRSNPSLVSTDYNSPLVTLRADPYLYKHEATGKYYFTGSYPDYDRIELTSADSVNGISAAVPKTIWTMPEQSWFDKNDPFPSFVWAPEIHYVQNKWVIYFTLSNVGKWDIRSCTLVCNGDDPMTGAWEFHWMEASEGDDFSFKAWGFSLDMTVFENNGRWYAVWAQKDPYSNLYLAELDGETPYKLKSKPILLTKPEYDWELKREKVNEGAGVFKHAGKIFVTFSGAATGYEYCMGLLEIDDDKDLLDKSNWKKYDKPVFVTDPALRIYGPGHNNFTTGDNGELLCILHFRSYRDITGDSLYDYNRHAHVMKVEFDESGLPVFRFDPEDLYNVDFTNHGA